MEKEKLFKLVLEQPDTEPEILAIGTEDYCESKRLDLCLEKNINTAFLKTIELAEDEDTKVEENKEENSLGMIKKLAMNEAGKLIDWLFK